MFATNASPNLEDCRIPWLCMVNALSKQSLLLLRVEEVSQTIRGAGVGCVVQITLQDARAQESDCVSALSAPELLMVQAFS